MKLEIELGLAVTSDMSELALYSLWRGCRTQSVETTREVKIDGLALAEITYGVVDALSL